MAISKNRGLSLSGKLLGRSSADIEDLFEEAEYLGLYNAAFGTALKPQDLQGG